VEVDGGQHAVSAGDAVRDATLARHGWRVARYWNRDVLCNTDGVLQDIARLVAAPRPLTPTLSRKGRGGGPRAAGARSEAAAPPPAFAPPLPPAGEGRGEGAPGALPAAP
jgi:hypothetical protein